MLMSVSEFGERGGGVRVVSAFAVADNQVDSFFFVFVPSRNDFLRSGGAPHLPSELAPLASFPLTRAFFQKSTDRFLRNPASLPYRGEGVASNIAQSPIL